MFCARRAGCDESRLSGSTEARRRNPHGFLQRVIPTFDPISPRSFRRTNQGDGEKPESGILLNTHSGRIASKRV